MDATHDGGDARGADRSGVRADARGALVAELLYRPPIGRDHAIRAAESYGPPVPDAFAGRRPAGRADCDQYTDANVDTGPRDGSAPDASCLNEHTAADAATGHCAHVDGNAGTEFEVSSGNVFADLGLPDPEAALARAKARYADSQAAARES